MMDPGAISMAHWRPDKLAWPEDVAPAQFVGDDLAIGGRALTSLSNPELLPLLQRAAERHRADSH